MSPTLPARPGFCAARAVVLALGLFASPVFAQVPAERKFVNTRAFGMPFSLTPADRANITSMKLYIRPEQGGEWQLHATASPSETRYDAASRLQVGNFSARVERDGTYAFAIMTVFANGRSEPMAVDQLRPDQWVTVDTRPPDITLTALAPRPRPDGKVVVGVSWKVQDETLVKGGVRLEGRWFGSAAWSNFARGGPAEDEGTQEWTIPDNLRMEVRVSATDRAGNTAAKTAILGAKVGTVTGGAGGLSPAPDPAPVAGQPSFRLVNSRDVKLSYRVRELPPSGLKQIDLYVTRLGNDWTKHEKSFPAPGANQETAEIDFAAPEDGTYGFTMIATSNAGQAPPPPKANDPPQVWVEVDTQKPAAEIKTARLVSPTDPRSIVLEWKASDKNIEALPIIFEYAEVDASGVPGKWTELTTPLPNSGRYVCPAPVLSDRAYQFALRMNVYDKAGNAAVVPFDKFISLDVVKPQVEITDVKTAPKGGP